MIIRPTPHDICMTVAQVIASRSTCSRKHVGSVIARNGRIISSGYNGAPSGLPHCIHNEQDINGCEIATHAEENAIFFAARYGLSTLGATLYATVMPCARCARAVINAGIVTVVWDEPYRDATGIGLLHHAGIETISFRGERYAVVADPGR